MKTFIEFKKSVISEITDYLSSYALCEYNADDIETVAESMREFADILNHPGILCQDNEQSKINLIIELMHDTANCILQPIAEGYKTY